MKKVLSIAFICVLSLGFIGLNAQELFVKKHANTSFKVEEVNSKNELKYCSSEMDYSTGTGVAASLKAAIMFPAPYVEAYVGSTITAIKVGIGALPVANTKVWIASSLTGKRLYEQTFDAVVGWNTVVLETPYAVKSGDMVIGYDVRATGSGDNAMVIGISDNVANTANGGNISVSSKWSTLNDFGLPGNMCIIGVVEGNVPDFNDVNLVSTNLKSVIRLNTDFTLKGTVENHGNVSVTSYDINYKIGDAAPVELKVTGVNIGISESHDFTFPAPLRFTANGNYHVVVAVTKVNGMTDGNDTDGDNIIEKQVTVATEVIPRKVVMEHFTTEQCPNCPAAEKNLQKWVGNNPDVVWISNHSGFGTDQYTVNSSYLSLFNQGSYAPAITLDRTNMAESGATGSNGGPAPGPVFFPSAITPALVMERVDAPAYASVNFEIFNYNPITRDLTFKVSGRKIAGFTGDNTVLTVFLVEDDLYGGEQKQGTPDFRHQHVLRKVISGTWGDKIEFTDNNYSKEYTLKVDNKFNVNNLKVAAFLSNYKSSDMNSCYIHNGEQVAFIQYKPEGSFIVRTPSSNEAFGRTEGAGFYMPGTEVTIKANPKTGRKFLKWMLDGVAVSTEATYTFTMPGKDVDYVAVYDAKFTVKVEANNAEYGTCTTSTASCNEYDDVTLTATANEGAKFGKWVINDVDASTDATYTFKMPANNIKCIAVFYYGQYDVNVNIEPAEGGTCAGAGKYYEADEVTLVATANDGYQFVKWTVNGKDVSTETTYKFTMIDEAVHINAIFQHGDGVNNISDLKVRIYPNPAKNNIKIEGEYTTLSIIDITGKVVKTVMAQPSIDVSDLNNGIYVLNIVGESGIKTVKMMISK